MTEPLLVVDDLHVKYAAVKALFGISLDLDEGAVIAVLGVIEDVTSGPKQSRDSTRCTSTMLAPRLAAASPA